MTQRQIRHPDPLPACSAGHVARHIHDARSREAGGGHLIECQCSNTRRHADFDDALQQWCQDNGHKAPKRAPQRRLALGNVYRFGGTPR
ncbi:MAG: hypothetical protein ACREPV_01305 [Lysobacter sp.]